MQFKKARSVSKWLALWLLNTLGFAVRWVFILSGIVFVAVVIAGDGAHPTEWRLWASVALCACAYLFGYVTERASDKLLENES